MRRQPLGTKDVKELYVDTNEQPNQPGVTPHDRKERRAKLIRLNDLLPKKDIKGGSSTVFGAARSRGEGARTKQE